MTSNRHKLALLVLAAGTVSPAQQKFRPDDPLRREPDSLHVTNLKPRRINQWYDYLRNTFESPGEANERPGGPYPAQSVNTLGEVLDSAWFVNRELTHEQIVRGPGDGRSAPDPSGPWEITRAKTEGVTPGFVIRDPKGRRYVMKFDPLDNPEMATGADVVSAKLLHAIGYYVPENYVVFFGREQLKVGSKTEIRDPFGRNRRMTDKDVGEILVRVPRVPDGPNKGKIRAVASLYVQGEPLGPFKYYGRRPGDRNDFIPHEHRRELRGLHAIFGWLNHHDSRSINSLDTLVTENGRSHVRHYLIDFGSTLGSAAVKSKSAREGNAYLFSWNLAAANFFSLGAYVRHWESAHYPYFKTLGRLQWDEFDPEEWLPNYRNRAFLNRTMEDMFWAAKKVMRFTDEDIRAVAAMGQYSDPAAERWLAECLIRRRDIVGRTYFTKAPALDEFTVREGRLAFSDLAARYKFAEVREYTIQWSAYDNATGQSRALSGAAGAVLPEAVRNAGSGTYWMAEIAGQGPKKVRVYLRRSPAGHEVAGVERQF